MTDFHTEDPLVGIEKMAEMPDFARRGEDPNSDHILSLYRNGDTAELSRRVWEAQLQVLFPIIELLRVKIIKSLESDLEECLSKRNILQFLAFPIKNKISPSVPK